MGKADQNSNLKKLNPTLKKLNPTHVWGLSCQTCHNAHQLQTTNTPTAWPLHCRPVMGEPGILPQRQGGGGEGPDRQEQCASRSIKIGIRPRRREDTRRGRSIVQGGKPFPQTREGPSVQRMKGPTVPTRQARGRVSTSIHIKVRTLTCCMRLDHGAHTPKPTARTTSASIGAFYFCNVYGFSFQSNEGSQSRGIRGLHISLLLSLSGTPTAPHRSSLPPIAQHPHHLLCRFEMSSPALLCALCNDVGASADIAPKRMLL
jgi:hypothetical protein